jgi:hypothetical protein
MEVVITPDIAQPASIKERKASVFLQGAAHIGCFLWRMTVHELAVSIILVLF